MPVITRIWSFMNSPIGFMCKVSDLVILGKLSNTLYKYTVSSFLFPESSTADLTHSSEPMATSAKVKPGAHISYSIAFQSFWSNFQLLFKFNLFKETDMDYKLHHTAEDKSCDIVSFTPRNVQPLCYHMEWTPLEEFRWGKGLRSVTGRNCRN